MTNRIIYDIVNKVTTTHNDTWTDELLDTQYGIGNWKDVGIPNIDFKYPTFNGTSWVEGNIPKDELQAINDVEWEQVDNLSIRIANYTNAGKSIPGSLQAEFKEKHNIALTTWKLLQS